MRFADRKPPGDDPRTVDALVIEAGDNFEDVREALRVNALGIGVDGTTKYWVVCADDVTLMALDEIKGHWFA